MVVDDTPKVYLLGRQLFKLQEGSTFYRTWDAYEVTNNFNLNPHLTLFAESCEGVIVGFAPKTCAAPGCCERPRIAGLRRSSAFTDL